MHDLQYVCSYDCQFCQCEVQKPEFFFELVIVVKLRQGA